MNKMESTTHTNNKESGRSGKVGSFLPVFLMLVVIISVIGLIYTTKVVKQEAQAKEGMDEPISDNVQAHPYAKNPVFWAYILAGAVTILLILYLASTWW